MRLFLLAAVVAVAAVIGLLVYERRQERTTPDPHRPPADPGNGSPGHVRPAPLEDVADLIRTERSFAKRQEALVRFVAETAGRGDEAVAPLLALLRAGKDQSLRVRWSFKQGRLDGYPTLRAAYLEALRAIRGPASTAALEEVFADTGSAEESYLIALALEERGAAGWGRALLDRATRGETPAQESTRREMVALVARSDPSVAAQHLLANAPRGEDKGAPRTLARALEVMPLDHAAPTAERLLADPEVTVTGKSFYVRSICARPEVEALSLLRRLAERGDLDERMRREAAYQAADAVGFRLDVIAYHRAVAEGKGDAAAAVRDRFERRMDEVHRYVAAALSIDLTSLTDDPLALALQRRLDAHRKALAGE